MNKTVRMGVRMTSTELPADSLIRDFHPDDRPAVLDLNEKNQPEVGPMDADKLAWFAEYSPFFKVVERDGQVRGFLIGLTDSQNGYGSPNYLWFADRHDSFAYVDRIALAESVRGQGWGPTLYRQLQAWALATGKPVLCAEVNTIPANPRSLRFHEIFGMSEVGRCRPYGALEEVAMVEMCLGTD